jgi:NADH-quinone oxidoreductase subunit C
LKIDREALLGKAREMRGGGMTYLVKITAVDYVDRIEVVYFLRDASSGRDETIEVEVDPADSWVPSIMGVYRAADWHERELSEMFGIEIRGRECGRLLLEKWNGRAAPLRKNFAWGEPYEKK